MLQEARWKAVYEMALERLINFMVYIVNKVPDAKFLVYSRGTDPEWLKEEQRLAWVKKIETRFPELKGHIITMLVEGGYEHGTFRNTKTAEDLRDIVTKTLGLPEKTK